MLSRSPMRSRCLDIVIPAFNAEAVLGATADRILAQVLPAGWQYTIIVVDDGSVDNTAVVVQAMSQDRVRLVRLESNRGRSGALNAGIAAGTGDYVLICDADCCYTDRNCLAKFIAGFQAGADVVIGSITAKGEDFWSCYLVRIQSMRERRAGKRGILSFTTANIGLRRSVLERIGGFNAAYRHYGFEDRELLFQVSHHRFETLVDPTLKVNHEAKPSLTSLALKMRECGRYSSTILAKRFPSAYRSLPYYWLDIRSYGSVLARLWFVFPPLVSLAVLAGEPLLRSRWLPFALKAALVKTVCGLAYLHGTCLAVRSEGLAQSDEPAACRAPANDRDPKAR
ncbi:MAG: hypothetical protein BMS9Abin10_0394 [Gammaproteobacteria bacterium]|nr:MAG: hypothetical protein BMS9Abin10_0394 [Gammaproteobacteria bacterium]